MRHVISGCSINVELLTDRELDGLINLNKNRQALLDSELTILVDEHVRRIEHSNAQRSSHYKDPPASF